MVPFAYFKNNSITAIFLLAFVPLTIAMQTFAYSTAPQPYQSPATAATHSTKKPGTSTVNPAVIAEAAREVEAQGIAPSASDPQPVDDPFETYNRFMFSFNRFFDKFIVKPVAEVYSAILPNPAKKGVSNFFSNLDMVPTIANDIMQLRLYDTLSDTWRLFFNSTLGIGGLFDVATPMGLPLHEEDFGLTLARWGYTDSAYFVFPFLGPRTVRDALGVPVYFMYTSVYPYIHPATTRNALLITYAISKRSDLLSLEGVAEQIAFDRYTFERNVYLQRRAYQIQQNKLPLPQERGKEHEKTEIDADTYIPE